MNQSLFIEYVSKIWPKLSLYVNEKVNGKKTQPTYLHKTMLNPVYSADQKWEGTLYIGMLFTHMYMAGLHLV